MPVNRGHALLLAGAWGVLLFLMLPTLVAFPVSLTPNHYLSLPTDGLSLRHWRTFLVDPIWRGAVAQSLGIALTVTALATAIGTAAAVALWRLSSWAAEAVRALALAPMIVPPVVSALAFYRAWAGFGLLDTFTGVILAHTLLAIPYVMISVSAALAGLPLRQEQASRSLGAGPLTTIRRVVLPQVTPGITAGAVFAFITSWDEIVVTLFIAARTVYTLPRKMWDGINERVDPTIAAAATLIFMLTLVVVVVQLVRESRRASEPAGG